VAADNRGRRRRLASGCDGGANTELSATIGKMGMSGCGSGCDDNKFSLQTRALNFLTVFYNILPLSDDKK
jgi:hypothetical protein